MELLKKKRGGFRSQLTQVNKQVQGIWESRNTAELDPLELQSIKMRIQNIESKLSELDGEIGNSIAADDETEMDEEASKAVYYSEIVWDVVSKVDILIQKFSPKTVPVQNSEQVASNANLKPATKLPKLTIQTFDGDPLNWQGLWDSYRHSIHENKDLDEIEKFQHLKSLLTGDAKVVADGYRLTSANYSTVIEVLVDRFGSEELAVFAHFDKLLALPMSSTDTQKLQATYDATEKHIRSLVSLGLGEETFGQVFTPIILSKLPRSIRTDLHRRNGSNRWTLSHLRELFRDEIKARQMGDWTLDQHPDRRNWKQGPQSQGKGSNGNPKPPPHTGGALSGGAVKGSRKKGDRPLKCLFCSGNHRHSECKQVTTADARRELAKGLCYRCLRKGHMSKNCEKPPKCYFCGQNTHHSSLCFSQFGTPAQKDSSGSKGLPKNSGMLGATVDGQTGLDPSTPPFQPDPHSTGPTSFQGVANSSAKPGFVQMQMASVKLGSIQSPIRIFFDCGCLGHTLPVLWPKVWV